MARGDILCPIDSLVLGLPVLARLGSAGTDTAVGEHVHMSVTMSATCTNGHTWAVRERIQLVRTV